MKKIDVKVFLQKKIANLQTQIYVANNFGALVKLFSLDHCFQMLIKNLRENEYYFLNLSETERTKEISSIIEKCNISCLDSNLRSKQSIEAFAKAIWHHHIRGRPFYLVPPIANFTAKENMKPLIREKRKLSIDKKHITPEMIRSLAKIIEQELASLSIHEKFSVIYSVDAMDNSSYESQSISIFDTNEILDKKPIHKITMKFNTLDYSKNIELQIIQTQDATPENYISVSGDDSIWVNGIIGKMSEVLNLGNGKPKIVNRLGLIITLLCIAFLYFYFRIMLLCKFNEGIGFFPITFMVIIPFSILFGFVQLHNYLQTMWPDVELQTGPNYLQIPLQKREKLYWIIAAIAIPTALEIAFDLFKHSFK